MIVLWISSWINVILSGENKHSMVQVSACNEEWIIGTQQGENLLNILIRLTNITIKKEEECDENICLDGESILKF